MEILAQEESIGQQFIRDVKAGMSDDFLQEKYAIFGKKFFIYKAAVKDFLAKEKEKDVKGQRKISAKQFIKDVRDQMDDDGLMIKYNLTTRQLQSLFRQLIEAGLFTPLQLSNRLKITKSQVTEAFAEMGKAVRELD